MTLLARFQRILATHPEWPPHVCLARAVTAHRLAQFAETAMRIHPDAFALIDAHLAQREASQSPQLSLLAAQENRGPHPHD